MTQQTKVYVLPLKVHSRVRVVSVTVQASTCHGLRQSLLKCLNATGTVTSFDPRWTLSCIVKLDDGEYIAFAEDNLVVLEPTEPLQQLIEAIGRHPAAENDPSVIDALNAVEDALRQKEAG